MLRRPEHHDGTPKDVDEQRSEVRAGGVLRVVRGERNERALRQSLEHAPQLPDRQQWALVSRCHGRLRSSVFAVTQLASITAARSSSRIRHERPPWLPDCPTFGRRARTVATSGLLGGNLIMRR